MTDKTFKDYLKEEKVQENYLKYFLGNPRAYKKFSDVDKGMTEEEFNKKYPDSKGEYAKIKKEIADMNESKQINEDSVDMEKHNTLNDIFQALERLNTEVDELDALDSDMDSTGVGDLNDQLTTFRKHIGALYQVLDRAGRIVPMESVNEEVDSELMDEVIIQIKRDCDMGDYTAIEELLMSCPEDKLRGFLSEVDESVNEEVIRIRAVKEKADLKLPTTGINRKFDGPNAKEHAAKAKQQFEKDGYHVVYETNSKDLETLKKLAGI